MNEIKLFEHKKVRSHFDNEKELWHFSVIDVIEILTESPRARKYWSALKTKLKAEGSKLSQDLGQLKLQLMFKKERNETVMNCHGLKVQIHL